MADDFGYHIDHHGSLVRPPQLLAARAAGLSGEELAAVTDDPVADERGDADIAVATNGGFAQVAEQPLMSEPEQRAKLQLVEMVARYYRGNEI
jgi:hypothetical protein